MLIHFFFFLFFFKFLYNIHLGPTICASCKCDVENGEVKCVRTDTRRGACPSTCGQPCPCNLLPCPQCFCSYKVSRCPRICPTSVSTGTTFENDVLPSETN